MAVDIAQLLAFAVKNNASDLHLSAGVPPMIRVDGDIKRINMPALTRRIPQYSLGDPQPR
jgi:twitching motility protein PilT